MDKQIEILIEAMKAQVAKPTRAVVNPEAAFVAQRLRQSGEDELAKKYWSWTCSYWEKNPIFGEEVQVLQQQLRDIDKGVTMPAWGTYGT